MKFSDRHIGPNEEEQNKMLGLLNSSSLDDFTNSATPSNIRLAGELDLPQAFSESGFLKVAERVAGKNKVFKSFIGQGYYDTLTPTVIQRNILENPSWYTAYTPYQSEISQGRMEALLNFQSMVTDLTGLDMANASLLDEATAVAEAITLAKAVQRQNKSLSVFVDNAVLAQTHEVIMTRCEAIGFDVVRGDFRSFDFAAQPVFASVLQYPGSQGEVHDIDCYRSFVDKSHNNDALCIVAADLMSLCLLEAPGSWGADIVCGNSQRFGVPMGFGGPHAAFMATSEKYKRSIPGRIIGVSKDRHGNPAMRLALQTREQHIRREKATSNICTAQVLLAVMASMYAVYHGPKGLKKIAQDIHDNAQRLASALQKMGHRLVHTTYFDTLAVQLDDETYKSVLNKAQELEINFGREANNTLLIAVDEAKTPVDLDAVLQCFADKHPALSEQKATDIFSDKKLARTTEYLTHPTFNSYHTETELLRYIHRLSAKDLSLTHSMIPLGSCTMKLNATSEMIPVTWKNFSGLHPFAPLDQAEGYMEMIQELESWICQFTGFDAVSLQPNAGSQGEYAGLLAIRNYHKDRGDEHRKICLIPSSAHGTNPASAVMAGLEVKVVKCDTEGNIDVLDLQEKAKEHAENLSSLMITYPSTHGVFESSINEICKIIHDHGGQVYMDGANLNALVGLSRPGDFGADVCHLNLHKTFCIPHGGGGPGIGPIGVKSHLAPFLPGHHKVPEVLKTKTTAVSAAPWGSASILPISWAYMKMMGGEGLKKASQVAILNANYIAKRLEGHYSILYRGQNERVAHECIIDTRDFKDSAGITVDDIAKRLIDYGFHAPTMSWPVAGTLMIEPTESESLAELDRFCDAMIEIRNEIRAIESDKADRENNVLKNAPHNLDEFVAETWDHPYTRRQAAYPLPWVKTHKFWSSVGRVDNAFGDRNLVCTCPDLSEYQ